MNDRLAGLGQIGRRRAGLFRSVEVRTGGVGRENRDGSIGEGGGCGQRGAGRRREARRVECRPSNTMLGVAIASPRSVHMGEIGARTPRHAVIEQLVQAREREPAPKDDEQQHGSTASNEPLRHRVHDTTCAHPRSRASS
jgi:hypothetical protein